MNESSNPLVNSPYPRPEEETAALALANAEIARLSAELDDLKLLYEAMIEHGEAVEDQLAEQNQLLERIQTRLEAELLDATNYVFSILPEKRTKLPLTDYLLVPSTELGGDSFGYHALDDEHFAFYLLDVCGHGVGAALLSVAAINVLRASALVHADFRDPSSVLAALNNTFPMEKQNNMFFTIWYGVYNTRTKLLNYATGGHPPAILLRAGSSTETAPELLMTSGGIVIGAFPDVDYESSSIEIGDGDRLLVLSDGTFEVNGPGGDMLSVEDLAAFAARAAATPKEIHEWVRSYNSDGPLPDDFSLLEMRF